MPKVGFNALTQADRERHKQYIKDHKPPFTVVMNDPAYASELAALGTTKVILRIRYQPDEWIHEQARDGREWWDSVKIHYSDKKLLVYIGNELQGNWSKIGVFLKQAAVAALTDGVAGVVVGNFSVGTPEPEHWAGALSEISDLCSNDSRVFMGIHEYLHFSPFLGMSGFVWNNGVVDTTPEVPLADRTKYIIGRYENAVRVKPNIKLVVTEWGADNIQDLVNNLGVPPTSGWREQFNDSEIAWGGVAQTTLDLFYKSPNIKGINLFSLGDSGGWSKYDYTGTSFFFNTGLSFGGNVVTPVTNHPLNVPVQIKSLDPNALTRIRATPPAGAIVGAIPAEFTDAVLRSKNSDGWYNLVLEPSKTVGWSRGDLFVVETSENPDPPNYIPVPPPELNLEAMSPTERSNTAELFEYFGNVFKYFAEEIRSYK